MTPISIDLFSGCGGLSLGLSQAGFEHLFAVEAQKDAFATYRENLIARTAYNERWPSWLPLGPNEITEVVSSYWDQLVSLRGTIDLVAGGPPCQGFSMNGRRDPDDPRSKMIGSYLDFVDAVRPRLVLLENVRGFASMPHPAGGLFPDFAKSRLSELGYEAFDTVLAASEWGVPQRRPRYILIAYAAGTLPGVNPIERLQVSRRNFLARMGLGPDATPVRDALYDLETAELSNLVPDAEYGRHGFLSPAYNPPTYYSPYLKLMRDGFEGAPSDIRLARHTEEVQSRMAEVLSTCPRGHSISPANRSRLGINKRSTTPLDPAAPSPTITTLPDDLIHYSEPRTMSVREHARIQSFPDWFRFTGPYTTGGARRKTECPRYTQVGNSVPPLLARAIGETLMSLLRDQKPANISYGTKVAEKVVSVPREIVDRHIDVPALA